MKPSALVGSAAMVVLLVGCGGERQSAESSSPSTVTNVVEVRREVVVTNLVTVTMTNVVTVKRLEARILSARKTAPYAVACEVLNAERLRRVLADAGARVITCSPGAVGLIEARDDSVATLRVGGVVSVSELAAADKIVTGGSGAVRVVPTSTIDAANVVAAIRQLGGKVVQVITVGRPLVRAELSRQAIEKLASRGDVRRIEKDAK